MSVAVAKVASAAPLSPPTCPRMNSASALLKKLSSKAAKNWHQNKGANRRETNRGACVEDLSQESIRVSGGSFRFLSTNFARKPAGEGFETDFEEKDGETSCPPKAAGEQRARGDRRVPLSPQAGRGNSRPPYDVKQGLKRRIETTSSAASHTPRPNPAPRSETV